MDNHLDYGVDELSEFMSYFSESLASEFAEELLRRGYVFSAEEMFDLDVYVTEKTLSKAVLSEAVRTCKETFSLSDFKDLEVSVSREALFDVAKRQGNQIKYDEYEDFYIKD